MGGNGKILGPGGFPAAMASNSMMAMLARLEKRLAQSGVLSAQVGLIVVIKPDGNLTIQSDGVDAMQMMLLLAQAQEVVVANMLRAAKERADAQRALARPAQG